MLEVLDYETAGGWAKVRPAGRKGYIRVPGAGEDCEPAVLGRRVFVLCKTAVDVPLGAAAKVYEKIKNL